MPTAHLVVDLGFGDAGKGTITDFLCRERDASWVLRFNGGAQAGHNVVTSTGQHHTFAQLGAGSFLPGVQTYLCPAFLLHPGALLVEAAALIRAGAPDPLPRLAVARSVRVITPFHQALGRLRELSRGDQGHGTCGVGIGETVRDSLDCPKEALRAGDLLDPDPRLRDRIHHIRARLAAHRRALSVQDPTADGVRDESMVFELEALVDRWLEQIAPLRAALRDGTIRLDDGALAAQVVQGPSDLVFEGAQGILLDEEHGFHPHTTWSRCTDAGARDFLKKHDFTGSISRIGVIRTYMTRHGHGPLPSHAPALDALLPEPHNDSRGWQGAFRRGWADPILWRYAIRANGGLDGLAVTHLDHAPKLRQFVMSYCGVPDEFLEPTKSTALRSSGSLDSQARLSAALSHTRPVLAPLVGDFIPWIEAALQTPVAIASYGPRSTDKRRLQPTPR